MSHIFKFVLCVAALTLTGWSSSALADMNSETIQAAQQMNAANALVRQGEIDKAIEDYQSIDPSSANRDELNYNLAVAEYRNGQIESAKQRFSEAAATSDASIASKARYNLGDCLYSEAVKLAGNDKPAAIETLRTAISHYRSSLQGNPNNVDARANIELAGELIRRLQLQQQKQKEQDKQREQQQDDRQQQDQNQQRDQSQQNQSQQNQSQQEQSQQDQAQQEQNQQQQNQSQQEQNQQQSESNEGSKQNDQSSNESQDQPSAGEEQSEPSKQNPSDQEDQSAGSKSESEQAEQPQENQTQSQPESGEPQRESSDEQPGASDEPSAAKQAETSSSSPSSANNRQSNESQSELPAEGSAEESVEENNKPIPTGELSAVGEEEPDGKPNGVMTDSERNDGLMSKEEALKMLQAVRDRDMLRRLRQEQIERSRHIPVDRDW
jgi:Ca-activated chloride channel family protein